mmetsp:Transcript_30695/g.34986  ORF Transcript_30695/g.34986 Transcript_30695/m.34986 type:complete len:248 (+) Transcript_30695:79-822(+)|eukprot:CAMPEP_0194153110 /NCGR_PEP_ID=MMETSP0152-20130528/55240_1 /TAXON_ID=1049557 /ORGANISM="Thalassiothrix antarctica, Strain L6-D1" /LENGTH=247 /DNA_ID=CAMNT_0038858177 /DNA_START=35 /DNA_END=778 /DNA_ORIENTATION=+
MSWFWVMTMIMMMIRLGVAYQILGEPKKKNKNDDTITVPLPHLDTTLELYQQTHERDGSVSMAGTPWPASFELANYMTHPSVRNQFVDKTVLELGSGLGICSITASLLGPRRVIATDGSSTALSLLRRNVQKYEPDSTNNIIQVRSLEWGMPLAEDVRKSMHREYPDIILASDVIYPRSNRVAFKQTLQELCGPDTIFLLGHTWRVQNDEDDAFFDSIGIPYTPNLKSSGSRPAVNILEFRQGREQE